MKGLLVKDVCILKLQKNAVLVFTGNVCGIHSFHEKSHLYCQSVSACMAFFVVLGTLDI